MYGVVAAGFNFFGDEPRAVLGTVVVAFVDVNPPHLDRCLASDRPGFRSWNFSVYAMLVEFKHLLLSGEVDQFGE